MSAKQTPSCEGKGGSTVGIRKRVKGRPRKRKRNAAFRPRSGKASCYWQFLFEHNSCNNLPLQQSTAFSRLSVSWRLPFGPNAAVISLGTIDKHQEHREAVNWRLSLQKARIRKKTAVCSSTRHHHSSLRRCPVKQAVLVFWILPQSPPADDFIKLPGLQPGLPWSFSRKKNLVEKLGL